MKIKKFENILSWQKSQKLALRIYQIFKDNRIIVLEIGFRER